MPSQCALTFTGGIHLRSVTFSFTYYILYINYRKRNVRANSGKCWCWNSRGLRLDQGNIVNKPVSMVLRQFFFIIQVTRQREQSVVSKTVATKACGSINSRQGTFSLLELLRGTLPGLCMYWITHLNVAGKI